MIGKISQYTVFSALDIQSAYHQIPILENEKQYTAFEACGNLYQFCRIPFGITIGVACFHRVIDTIIRSENLKDTFAYIDNLTICGKDRASHDANLERFSELDKSYGLTFNDDKSIIATNRICILGYDVSYKSIRPDPERLQPLRNFKPPWDLKSQQRALGLFAYYSHLILHFSDKIHLLNTNRTFPFPREITEPFESLNKDLENAFITTVDHQLPLTVKTDASDIAIAATLIENHRPVAFFSRTLSISERRYSSSEKEAHAIVEAIRRWRHFLLGTHFKIFTDQRSVAFMFNAKHSGKIKNDKIQRWRIELSNYTFDIVYRPGAENDATDVFSRTYCSPTNISALMHLHKSLSSAYYSNVAFCSM